MSQTNSRSEVDFTYWRSPARITASHISRGISERRIIEIPAGIRADMARLFEPIREFLRAPEATRAPETFLIALTAARKIGVEISGVEELHEMIGTYADLMTSLENPRQLKDEELAPAHGFQIFLTQIVREANLQAASRRSRLGDE